MTFGIRHLMMFQAVIGTVFVGSVVFPLSVFWLGFCLPFALVMLALTSPQSGTHLDVTARPGLGLLAAYWILSVVGTAIVIR